MEVIFERRSKKKDDVCVPEAVINVNEISLDDDLITNHMGLEIAERLRRWKGKDVVVEDSPFKTPKALENHGARLLFLRGKKCLF